MTIMDFIIDASCVITVIGLGVCFLITVIVFIPFYPIVEQHKKSQSGFRNI